MGGGRVKMLLKWLSLFTGIIIAAVLLYKFVFFVIIVPSASMYPTIEVGDRILTTRIHSSSSIKRGNILVFYSDEFKEVMVKRVIGLPNDKIEIDSNGNVFVNKQKLHEDYVIDPDSRSGTYIVPKGEYFFLGDFRKHSLDSRKWRDPFVAEEKILGRVKVTLFPFNRISIHE